jgi:hypothetical protein
MKTAWFSSFYSFGKPDPQVFRVGSVFETGSLQISALVTGLA